MTKMQEHDEKSDLEDMLLVEQPSKPKYVVKKKISSLDWNGGILHIKGYAYLEGVSIENEDMVYKALVLKNEAELAEEYVEFELPLEDDIVPDSALSESEKKKYKWAGFKGGINFSAVTKGGAPLPADVYNAFIRIEVEHPQLGKVEQDFPLGNVSKLLNNNFHSTKLEFYSARRLIQYNLMATQNAKLKTLRIASTKLKDVDPADLILTEKTNRKSFFIQKLILRFFYSIFCLFPIKENRVIFASDSREEMNGNFGFVYEEMLHQKLDLDYKFMLKPSIDDKKSIKELIQLAFWFATSKKIILDDFYPMIYPLKIREKADLIQVWHAVGAFKTFGYSRIGRPGGPNIKSRNHRNYTKAIVSSKNVVPHYAEGFGIDESAVIPTGVPRTDIFFDEQYKQEKQKELHEQYPFLKGKKVILFAPTFRGNGQSSAHYPFDVLDLDKLYKEFKDEYVFLFKIHPFVNNKVTIPYQYVDFFYDFSEYREVNDLLFITDILITDYSSVCFEYALLRKPMIFFAYDVEEYIQRRDFYFEYQSFIPGVLAKTTDDIIYSIAHEKFEQERVEPFVQYFFDDLDGRASERFVKQIILEEDLDSEENGNETNV
ncbi:polyribitolphosphotransferase [Alkalihalobacillus alcalophilus ATCC 27647 = CGMCC 1.3604]|uniref:Polyribitolphosphotransferase n=1 Tax=Alkalihalobacillus alcalophilus ATCC 27647 = CGMCC 1.3604 TaxID=1218173 RepID=A0A4S4JVF0_ALKAL|nr:CDP-glycerol glycerophosphotransferase family protein [Alkalihalobacillus alcalophilus]MED1562640.1 CDP-glycerol glycerophosphotransferase family protein [Alkalihalobacillus alcalophilus]THG88600.1 polyribitolphosphotransferase [Alkalihalobacillus alcalophilus ATCC 27647 = CGMCC 1.3604]